MRDIETRTDIETLIDAFYKRILTDEHIGFFFTKVVALDWDVHIPIMYDFWESILFDTDTYAGNPMLKHMALHQKHALEPAHFERWLSLWEETIQQHFKGTTATLAIEKAKQIGGLMQHKVQTY